MQYSPSTKLAMIFPEQKNPTQNLATTYIRREVETAEKVLKKIILKIVMVIVFLLPMLSDNLPRIRLKRSVFLYKPSKKPAMKANMVPLLM